MPEILYGKVEIKPTLAFARGTSLVLPAPTTLDLVNGEATANNVYPTPAPVAGQVEWAYRVKAIDTRGQSFEWMVGVPDSTGTEEFTTLPRYFETKPPLFGKGEKGDPGEAAKITIGTTTTGTTPSVTNSGTNQNAILNFVLPKGDKGDRGDGVPAGGTALQYLRKDSAGANTEWATLNKASVGLSNVDNTSDANKPVSNATQEALDALKDSGDVRWVRNDSLDQKVADQITTPDSSTARALSTNVDNLLQPFQRAADPLAYLDNVKIFATFPVREAGETSWIQGFSIENTGGGHYYVSNQLAGELRIDRRKIGTNVRTMSRKVATEDGAFSESLDWFYNAAGDICFIVWPKAMTFPGAYAIYNFSKGTLGPQVPIQGLVRGSRYGDIFVTTDVWGNNSPSRFYVYDWESITKQTPILLQEIPCRNYGTTQAKTQGMAYNGGFVFFAQGNQAENMTITVYNSLGTIEFVKSYSRKTLMDALNRLAPGSVTNPNYLYECEGAYQLNGKLYTLHIVNNNPSVVSDAVAFILEHNNIAGEKLESLPPKKSLVGEWQNVELYSGWTHQGTMPLQVRVNEDKVEIRGFAINASFTGGFTEIGKLPAGIPKPKTNSMFTVPGNTVTIRTFQFMMDGGIHMFSSNTSGAWYGVNGGSSYYYN